MAGDELSSSDKHIEALGLSPEFKIEEAQAALKEADERLDEAITRQRAVREQQQKRRREVDRARGGRVVADHGDDEEEDDLVAMHLNQFSYWGRGPRR